MGIGKRSIWGADILQPRKFAEQILAQFWINGGGMESILGNIHDIKAHGFAAGVTNMVNLVETLNPSFDGGKHEFGVVCVGLRVQRIVQQCYTSRN